MTRYWFKHDTIDEWNSANTTSVGLGTVWYTLSPFISYINLWSFCTTKKFFCNCWILQLKLTFWQEKEKKKTIHQALPCNSLTAGIWNIAPFFTKEIRNLKLHDFGLHMLVFWGSLNPSKVEHQKNFQVTVSFELFATPKIYKTLVDTRTHQPINLTMDGGWRSILNHPKVLSPPRFPTWQICASQIWIHLIIFPNSSGVKMKRREFGKHI